MCLDARNECEKVVDGVNVIGMPLEEEPLASDIVVICLCQ
jgi:hypothetical protein